MEKTKDRKAASLQCIKQTSICILKSIPGIFYMYFSTSHLNNMIFWAQVNRPMQQQSLCSKQAMQCDVIITEGKFAGLDTNWGVKKVTERLNNPFGFFTRIHHMWLNRNLLWLLISCWKWFLFWPCSVFRRRNHEELTKRSTTHLQAIQLN